MYFAAKGQWEKSNEFFKKQFEFNKRLSPGAEAGTKIHYAWALEKQGRLEEAKKMREEAQAEWERLDKKFEHVNLHTSFLAPINVVTGQEFEARIDIANPSKGKGSLTRIENLLNSTFKVLTLTPECTTHDFTLEMKDNTIEPFTVKTIKMKLKATKNGTYNLSPQVIYLDEAGQTKTSIAPAITLNAKPAQPTFETLPNRVPTGTEELDALLFGGIPSRYAVALASPSSDEREIIIKRFLETGAKADQITLHITSEPNNFIELAKTYPTNFILIVCNPQVDTIVQNAPNIFKLKGTENLTDIDITLMKAFRQLKPATDAPRRACIEITSDVLLQHHTLITRKWLSGLLSTLKSKWFTTIAVIDPQMHAPEEVQAIISLFEGEIRITEKETPQGSERTLRIRKLYNQKYAEKPNHQKDESEKLNINSLCS
jgi:KaiC/GvpD/RAD55 family RecA-like ATPase